LNVQTITDKPHGAVLAFDDVAFEKVGYFDESYGKYGMEHVDWSNRVSLSGIQPPGFHDIVGIEKFLSIGKSKSAVPVNERTSGLSSSRSKFNKHKNNRNRIFVKPSDKSKVSGVSFIIPFSGKDRVESLKKTISNIKSLRHPRIEIIICEEDINGPSDIDSFGSVKHVLVKPKYSMFCKSACINKGASVAMHGILFIHDADLLCEYDYIWNIMKVFQIHKSVHGGKNIICLNNSGKPDKMMTGFVGGSIACKKSEFFGVGGFNEAFFGHGYEDKDFYDRLSTREFFDCEIANFVHLYHDHDETYMSRSDKNKVLCDGLSKKPVGNRITLLRADLVENGYGDALK
jgi:predicted glycosyltransferase involved in capsule biosynthesis